jgi:hypothetical protein
LVGALEVHRGAREQELKMIDEAVEAAVVVRAREIAAEGAEPVCADSSLGSSAVTAIPPNCKTPPCAAFARRPRR